jgi:toxin CcdB
MAQFDVYRNPDPGSSKTIPYLLDIQTDLLAGLATRVVVPLIVSGSCAKPAKSLNPVFTIEDHSVVMSTQELAGVARSNLGDRVANLASERAAIITALDLLITGI